MNRLYHYNPHSRMVLPCYRGVDDCPVRQRWGSDSPHGRFEEIDRKANSIIRKEIEPYVTDNLKSLILKATDKDGLRPYKVGKSSSNERKANIDLLACREIMTYYAKRSCDPLRANPYMLGMSILAYIHSRGATKEKAINKALTRAGREGVPEDIKKEILRFVEYGVDEDKLAGIGSTLYSCEKSPFHRLARKTRRSEDLRTLSLRQKTAKSRVSEFFNHPPKNSLDRIDNTEVLGVIGATPDMLPDDVVSFGIDTEYRGGYKNNAYKGKITGVVLSGKEYTIVIRGSESYVLDNFAKTVNELKEGTTLVGWNSRGFDNIFLDVRAKYNRTKNWGGVISNDLRNPKFLPINWYEYTQRMVWRKPDGTVLFESDAMAMKGALDKLKGRRSPWSLSHYVRSRVNLKPFELDRNKTHKYPKRRLNEFAVSDGLSILIAYKYIVDRKKVVIDMKNHGKNILSGNKRL